MRFRQQFTTSSPYLKVFRIVCFVSFARAARGELNLLAGDRSPRGRLTPVRVALALACLAPLSGGGGDAVLNPVHGELFFNGKSASGVAVCTNLAALMHLGRPVCRRNRWPVTSRPCGRCNRGRKRCQEPLYHLFGRPRVFQGGATNVCQSDVEDWRSNIPPVQPLRRNVSHVIRAIMGGPDAAPRCCPPVCGAILCRAAKSRIVAIAAGLARRRT